MAFFDELNLQGKLTCIFLVLVVIFGAFGAGGLYCAQRSNSDALIAKAAACLKGSNAAISRDLQAISVANGNQAAISKRLSSLSDSRAIGEKTLTELAKLQGDTDLTQIISRLKDPEKAFLDQASAVQQANGSQKASLAADVSQKDPASSLQSSLDDLTDRSEKMVEKYFSFAVELLIAGIVAALGAAIFLSQYLHKYFAGPLSRYKEYAAQMMQGDISANLETPPGNDEVAALGRELSALGASWAEIAVSSERVANGDLTAILMPRSDKDVFLDAFNRMIENIAVVTVQFRESVTMMSSSAAEILMSVNDSAESASQTAAAATETSTIVEEVRQTSHVASEKAKQVSESAQTTAKISAMGRKATEDIIEGMSRIREQVDLIAEAMVALGEKSQSISGIIATVDDLAKQSNLLAVNASIEAAKAGEFGKGFGVVAQEVKNMAEQSKQSTAKVRTLIAEIQQATNAAAMATELGGKTVDAALAQSQQAGESIAALAGSVVQSAQAASQIAVSTQEQLTGVDQVAMAMESISKACSEHLAAINRVEVATNRLNEIGMKLKELVSIFDASQGSLPTASAFKNMPPV